MGTFASSFESARRINDFAEVCFNYYLENYTVPIPDAIEPWFNDLYADFLAERAHMCALLVIKKKTVSSEVATKLQRLNSMRMAQSWHTMRATNCHTEYYLVQEKLLK